MGCCNGNRHQDLIQMQGLNLITPINKQSIVKDINNSAKPEEKKLIENEKVNLYDNLKG